MRTFLLVALVAALPVPVPAQTVIPLEPWLGSLRAVPVVVEGDTLPFLFDTGGGVTILDGVAAERFGCRPGGRTGGFRASGEWVAFRECPDLTLHLSGLALEHDVVAEWDLVGFLRDQLPDGFEIPPIGGIVSLGSFAGRVITLDLAHDRVVVETPASLAERVAGMAPIPIRIATGEGDEMNVLVPAAAGGRTVWIKLDSGNVDRTHLDLHVASLLGLSDVPAPRPPDPASDVRVERTVSLEVAGLGPVTLDVAFEPMTIDGLAGLDLLARAIWTLDLAPGRGWVAAHR